MSRKEVLSSPEYWIAKAQMDLYAHAAEFMEANDLNRTKLAQHLGVSKGYVSQLLNGDYDHKLSKFIELAIAFGFVPKIDFIPIQEAISEDASKYSPSKPDPNVRYVPGNISIGARWKLNPEYESSSQNLKINVAC